MSANQQSTEAEAEKIFSSIDTDGDEMITKVQLMDYCKAKGGNLAKLTKVLNLDGRNSVSKADFLVAVADGKLDFKDLWPEPGPKHHCNHIFSKINVNR